jgi:VanZ family protein
MGLIFFLSAQPDLDSGLGALDFVLRKLAHATEFALLTLLWAWAIRPLTPRSALPAALIALAYAASDEYHQTFVTGRSGSPVDVAIDAAGVLLALAALRYHRRVRSVPRELGTQG